ncbi:MAG: Hcp family type VI secretion system effector [Chthoniobacterales bacterium]
MKLRTLFVFAVIVFAAVANVRASFNLYVKTEPALPGEVTIPAQWVDAWQVLSFSAGVSTSVQIHAGGLQAGSPNFQDVALMKMLDKASVTSLLKLAQGGHLDAVTLSCVNASTNVVVYEIRLEEVYFTSIAHSGATGGDDRPTESVSFAYGKIIWKYYPPSGPPITAFWDLRTNTGG